MSAIFVTTASGHLTILLKRGFSKSQTSLHPGPAREYVPPWFLKFTFFTCDSQSTITGNLITSTAISSSSTSDERLDFSMDPETVKYHALESEVWVKIIPGKKRFMYPRNMIENAVDATIQRDKLPLELADLDKLIEVIDLRRQRAAELRRQNATITASDAAHEEWIIFLEERHAKLHTHYHKFALQAYLSSQQPLIMIPGYWKLPLKSILPTYMQIGKAMQRETFSMDLIESSIKDELQANAVTLNQQSQQRMNAALLNLGSDVLEFADPVGGATGDHSDWASTFKNVTEAIPYWLQLRIAFKQLLQDLGPVTPEIRHAIDEAYRKQSLLWFLADMDNAVSTLDD